MHEKIRSEVKAMDKFLGINLIFSMCVRIGKLAADLILLFQKNNVDFAKIVSQNVMIPKIKHINFT